MNRFFQSLSWFRSSAEPPEIEDPIRAELFSIERLEQHAESLAAAQPVTADPGKGRHLSPRVRENGRVLLECYRSIARAAGEEHTITPAAEWLMDNFHVVDEQIREIREDLPPGYYRVLPKLAEGPLEGYPRVFGLAWAFVAHTDSRFDAECLRRFVRAYQLVQPLTIGEVWAVAITLRVVLVENLRRLAERMVRRRSARQEADVLADRLLGLGRPKQPAGTALLPFESAPLQTAFAAQLALRLREQDPAVTPALLWLDERLAAQGTTSEEIVRSEHQKQAAMNVTVRNVITSMRMMSDFDWAEFFEEVSLVDEILGEYAGYAAMDFATRDQYRHAIEDFSRASGLTEMEIAERALALARQARDGSGQTEGLPEDPRGDPGYFLISRGRAAFEKEIGFPAPASQWLARAFMASGAGGYLSSILALTAFILALPLLNAAESGMATTSLIMLGLLAIVPASDLAVALVNYGVTSLLGAMTLPKLKLPGGAPANLRTIVVVPTFLTNSADIAEQIERLEVHYLANPNGDLTFALLTDWTDAPEETMPADDELLAEAMERIARLNARHGPALDGGSRFFLLHRRRVWSESERKWIGWERKRGKIHELNRLLRGAADTTFLPRAGRPPVVPKDVRYVVTLDGDTRLPPGAVSRLVGTLAHPLNRARFDPRAGRVVEGYGVLQPRVTPSLPSLREGSLFQAIFSGPRGIDPYASAVSDVYQDLFMEGSYTGKGIYDVDAFEAALAGRVPENALLSHDLFEGTFARAGLVTDIELFEDFPSHSEVAAARQHRWARGDWQLLPWILGRSGIPAISRWKMLDNLRRTLSAPAAFLTLVAAWTLPLSSPALWTRFVLAAVALPAVLPLLAGLIPRRKGISKRSHLVALGRDLSLALSHVALAVTFLAHQAWLMTDAILRTLARLVVTRRRLLEWTTAAQAKSGLGQNPGSFFRRMWAAMGLAATVAIVVLIVNPEAAPTAAPLLVVWFLSPLVAWRVSLPRPARRARPLPAADARILRLTARRSWRFFEEFVRREDNDLPPDNFQEDPMPVVAHRTSPTNMGLYLLSTMASRDFGWIGTLDAIHRIEATLRTMEELERFRGHFYNWYGTRDLRPLEPRYVSTVDSGNLAGHLIVLGQACREILDRPLLDRRALSGIEDAVLLIRESASAIPQDRRTQIITRRQLDEAIDALAASLRSMPQTPAGWASRLAELKALAHTVVDMARALSEELGEGAGGEMLVWAEAARAGIASHEKDLDLVLPWARLVYEDGISTHATAPEQASAWSVVESLFAELPSPAGMPDLCEAALRELASFRSVMKTEGGNPEDALARVDALREGLENCASASRALVRRLSSLIQLTQNMVGEMEFGFLFEGGRKLFSVGYRATDGSLDPSYYDLLASEARLASFVAIAKGDISPSHWFRLGRPLTPVGWGAALLSWSGSMFEYLMPALVVRSPSESLLDRTYQRVVRRQIRYGAELGVPWGVSESAYNSRDLEMTYQYSNFGVPGLGLKRGLSEDVVVAPYATALAAMIQPTAAARNFVHLAGIGASGPFGFYEALDFTQTRLPEGKRVAVVKTYMAHHQGMSIVALANVIHDGAMRARFHAVPMVQAIDLLLQERTPRDVAVARPRAEEVTTAFGVQDLVPPLLRRFTSAREPAPRTHLLSNGRYAVMVTAAGSGYSRWRDLAVTRWREDATRDCWGTYIFLRDAQSGEVWSAGYQPSGVEPDSYEVAFSEDRAEFYRRDGAITTKLEVVVSPEDDAEIRRVTITNQGGRTREIELTSYAEIVLTPQMTDMAHPAFSNLFIQTESASRLGALLARRRPRSPDEPGVWAAHVLAVDGDAVGGVQCETDRARFLGRGRGIRAPMSVIDGRPLSNTVGSVLDPIFSLRRRVRLLPGASAHAVFSTLVAPSRDEVLALVDKYRDAATFERVVTLAWTQAQVQLHHLGIEPDEAHLFQRLAGRILYSDPSLRPSAEVLKRNAQGPAGLWAHGISGDLPIVVMRVDEIEDRTMVMQLLRAHEYWHMKQLAVDLVILNEKGSSYGQDLQFSLQALVRAGRSGLRHEGHEQHGSVFLLRADLISPEDRDLLQTVARAVLVGRRGSLTEQSVRSPRSEPAPVGSSRRPRHAGAAEEPPPRIELKFFNGLGGFAEDGHEYVTILGEGQWTPAPWINVIANESFGFQVSESGSGYTWSGNSRENQLTPWSNDPVSDTPGEAIYIRDEDTRELWSPTALPIRKEGCFYVARHGQGYSRFEHTSGGISLELLQFVPTGDPIKISRLAIRNHSGRSRRLSVTAFAEWVLGVSRSASAPFIVTEIDPQTKAMFARNEWNSEFGGRVAFADLGGRQTAWTGDRKEFLGRNGSPDRPAALEPGTRLSARVGAGLDPCAALQTSVEIPSGGRAEVVFLLGQAESSEAARSLVALYRTADLEAVLRTVTRRWNDILGALQVRTPDRSMDILLNRWLLYQALACRVWSRSALYQASGAYGFRDQLQDVMALAVAKREITREHLLRAAARQFLEGDVQHWWHAPSGRGVRTRFSDDLVWLPYAVIHYLEITGDLDVLDEIVPFLEGPQLSPGQIESYFEPAVSQERGTLFEHCARALDRSLSVGVHGLPLMGSGDWNDGMNRVGHQGKGESVWLGWFLHTTLWEFARLAEARGERQRAQTWRSHVRALKEALETQAWDGDWYRRAYFDDGTPLGSAADAECRIDSIAQSWGVISGAADPERARRAMAAVEEYLVRRGDGLVLLFAPPFDRTPLDPGYIKAYVPGVRENGGQYTHAALWALLAFVGLGEGDKAGELFAILNPINHAGSRAGIHRYKVEPYVAAADIYAAAPHVGRGGWTWYTGSAGWMYRAGIEGILGFRLRGTTLFLDPCIPRAWPGYRIAFRYHSARYDIVVENPRGVTKGVTYGELDGVPLQDSAGGIRMADDGETHRIRVVLG